MSEESNHIDEVIRQKLEGFEMTPPLDVWTKTEARITPQSKIKPFWMLFIGSGILVVLSFFIYFATVNSNKPVIQDDLSAPLTSKNEESTSKNSSSETFSSRETSSTDEASTSTKIEKYSGIDLTALNSDGLVSIFGLVSQRASSVQSRLEATNNIELTERNASRSANSANRNNEHTVSIASSTDRISDKSAGNSLAKMDNLKNQEFNSVPDQKHSDYSNTSTDLVDTKSARTPVYSPVLMKSSPLKSLDLGIDNRLETTTFGAIRAGKAPSRFSINVSAGISTFQLRAEKSSVNPELGSLLKAAPRKRQGLDFDLGVNYVLWKKLALHSGVQYSTLSEELELTSPVTSTYTYLDTINIYWDSVAMDSIYVTNTIYYDSTLNIAVNKSNSYQLMSIPFGVSWRARLSTRSSLECYLGGAINVYAKHQGNAISDEFGNLISASNAYKKSGQLSLNASLRYLYQLNEKHALYAEPWISSGISLFNTTSVSYKSRMYRSGIKLGYRFYF